MGKKKKKKLKAHKRSSFFASKPTFCKINVKDSGGEVFKYRGKLEEGWRQFKKLCVDQYQVDNEVRFDMSLVIDGLKQMEIKIPEIKPIISDKNDRGKKRKK